MDLVATHLRPFLPESELRVTPPDPSRTTPHASQLRWDEAVGELTGLIRALGIPPDWVDDVLQDVYLATADKLSANWSDDEARRWLFRVATNRCRLVHRQRSRWQRLLERLAAWGAVPRAELPPLEQRERTADIDTALSRLREVEREVVVLRYFCGLNSRQAGEVLELPETTVRSHLAKARRQLAHDLADWNE